MRRTTIGALITLVAIAGALVGPAPLAAASPAKVVVIVGPVGGMTASYKSDADAIAAEALTYTPDVVKIYTPNATWSVVKPALQGANVVVYLGHGNGFPSPYRTSPWPLTQNGLGLNPVAGGGDTNVAYYGESYLANEVRLAPNALVLLHHLCYASGNSEPGRGEPTLAVAQQRIDNYAAGFMAAGARVVIADAHYGSSYYLRSLFTTDQTLDGVWRGAPGAKGNYGSFQSTRTPGALGQFDPDTPTSGYYRSFVGDPSLTTGAVTGGGPVVASTSIAVAPAQDPTTFVVPGAAEVLPSGGALFPDPSLTLDPATMASPQLLPGGTPVRLQAAAGTAPDGGRVFRVATLDGTAAGYIESTSLAPRDSTAPRILTLDSGGGAFSPNGDGRRDVLQLVGTLSEDAAWTVAFTTPGGAALAQASGFGRTVAATWDGTSGGARLPDGSYRYRVTASDRWGNTAVARTGTVTLDTAAPTLSPATAASLAAVTFSPNGDGLADSVATVVSSNAAGSADVTVGSLAGQLLRTASATLKAGSNTIAWDGRADTGAVVPDGVYQLTIAPRDAAGNVGPVLARLVSVYTAVSSVRSSLPVFFPADPNATSPRTTTLSFALASPATVTWTISDAAGRNVVTQYLAAPLAPGPYSFTWDGRDTTGALVPPGTYYSNVRATDGTLTLRTRAPFVVGAFAITSSIANPARGQTITLTATSAEPLRAAPVLTFAQPRTGARRVTMSRSGSTYRVSLTVARTGAAGNATVTVTGLDLAGARNVATLSLAIR